MKQRDIAIAIILTLVTCGFYSIYWMIVLTDDIIAASEENFTSGVFCFLLTLVTCGIYGIYWAFKMGQLIQTAKQRHNMPAGSDMSVGYLILYLFGFNIINLALMQNEINHIYF